MRLLQPPQHLQVVKGHPTFALPPLPVFFNFNDVAIIPKIFAFQGHANLLQATILSQVWTSTTKR